MIPEFDGLTAPETAEALRFTLRGVEIEGSTVYTDDELRPLYEGLIGEKVSVADIYAFANAITEKYGSDGYTLSRAVVPEQEIDEGGVIRIEVVEGFIEDVEIHGEIEDRRGFFDYYEAQILAERPVRTQTLERYLLLADDLPGLEVRSVLRRSPDTPGAAILLVEVSDKLFSGAVSIDNRGTKPVGRVQINTSVTASNPLGLYDETRLRYVNAALSDELHYGAVSESILLHPEGTTLTLGAKHTNSEPGTTPLEAIEFETESFVASVAVEHPFIRTRQTNLSAYGKVDLRESETLALDSTLTEDSIRSARFGVSFDHADAYQGTNQAIAEVSQGLPFLGASDNDDPDNSRAEGRVDYTKVTLDLSRTQRLGYFASELSDFSIHIAGRGQWAANPLLSSEECGLGGVEFGRAYDPSAVLGDHCLAGVAEFRFQPATEAPLDYMQFYAFADVGKAWQRDDSADPKSTDFASFGGGFRMGLMEHFSGSLEIGVPLTDDLGTAEKFEPRAFFTLTGRF